MAGGDLSIASDRGRTKVTSTDLSDTSDSARDDVIYVDRSLDEVAARVCQPRTRQTLGLGEGEVILCTGLTPSATKSR